MDLAEIARVMRRRWRVLVPLLLLTGVLVGGLGYVMPTSYQSQSTVALVNSRKGSEGDGNPFLTMPPSLTGMADNLARNLNSDASARELRSRGLTQSYETKIADNALGPLLWLTVTGTDAVAVRKSGEILTAYAAERLEQFQADQSVRPEAMIRMTTVVPPQQPVAQTKTRTQYMVMLGALGFAVSLAAAFFVEARRRHQAASVPEVALSHRRKARTPVEAPAPAPVDDPTMQLPAAAVPQPDPDDGTRKPSWAK
ncbi:hypothetical protein SRB5_45480 [Streptomyces sp. RB5]|uniref:Chain length determinant protein n=1 Tax=Streptomyces smaragdinus TaxID=2585196 RepID=A0A7K0CMW4_9ACTN|nr:chain length determinant protein [Streptomyces smaragdinus]MQY14382.1 hypothetical protein [Streptomyces smaragdinus]